MIFPSETSYVNKYVLHDTYSKLRIRKHLSDVFRIRMVCNKDCFITTALHLRFRICNEECPSE